jgi:hypothetical protein
MKKRSTTEGAEDRRRNLVSIGLILRVLGVLRGGELADEEARR